jgi:two-component system, sensor histidine kinase YesM
LENLKHFFSLRYKILIFVLVVAIIPLFLVGIVSSSYTSSILKEKVMASKLKTIQQVETNLELILKSVNDLSLFLINSEDTKALFKLPENAMETEKNFYIDKFNRMISFLSSFEPYVHSLYIEGFNGIVLNIDQYGTIDELSQTMKNSMLESNGGSKYLLNKIDLFNNKPIDVISLIRLIKDVNNISSKLAFLKINISESKISKMLLSAANKNEGNYIFLVDEDKNIISKSSEEYKTEFSYSEIKNQLLGNAKKVYHEIELNNEKYLVICKNLDSPNWMLINIVLLKPLLYENLIIQKIIYLIILFCIVVAGVFSFYFSKRLIKPLLEARQLMSNIEDHKFNGKVEVTGNDEITTLAQSYNKLVNRLKELTQQIYVGKIHQREAELKALQAQVNPHFLYNTLDIIYWKSRSENAFESAAIVEALSKLFRLSLNSGNELTTVAKEVEHLESYIFIMKKRYGKTIQFFIDVQEETNSYSAIKLILQPLVENAINHGILQKNDSGIVNVSIFLKEGILYYQIIDNGVGIDIDRIKKLLKHTDEQNIGFGIKNVNDRIQLYFGKKFGVFFENMPSGGTKVTVMQPSKVKDN